MIEEDPVAGEHAVRLAVVDHDPVGVQLGNAVWRSKIPIQNIFILCYEEFLCVKQARILLVGSVNLEVKEIKMVYISSSQLQFGDLYSSAKEGHEIPAKN